MLPLEDQIRDKVHELRKEAIQNLLMAQDIEDGHADPIVDGDELVGFAFPEESELAVANQQA